MRFILNICSVALASAVNPEPVVDSFTDLTELNTTAEPTSSSDDVGSEEDGTADSVADDDQAVAINPILGEYLTELILNIEDAIDNYAYEIAVAEAVADADTTSNPSPTSAGSGDVLLISESDGSTETTSSTTSSPDSTTGTPVPDDTTQSVAV